jgi:ribosomal protein L11 methyltransferase
MPKEYVQIAFDYDNQDQLDMLVAQLSVLGFEGFNEEEAALGKNDGVGLTNALEKGAGHCKTFIDLKEFTEEGVQNELEIIFKQYGLNYSKSIVKEENWNAIWESNFEPVRIGDFVGIRAYFHPPFNPEVTHDIAITPKMSFGTGHHATTNTVIQLMKELDFTQQSVYDFGTGTGILAILAERLGATEILAVDNDDWCIENAIENIANNNCKRIKVQKVETAVQTRKFDIILANVNRHIIEANMNALSDAAEKKGILVLSGLLIEDQQDMINLADQKGWKYQKSIPLNGWISLLFDRL